MPGHLPGERRVPAADDEIDRRRAGARWRIAWKRGQRHEQIADALEAEDEDAADCSRSRPASAGAAPRVPGGGRRRPPRRPRVHGDWRSAARVYSTRMRSSMMPSGRSSLPPRKSFGAHVVQTRRTTAVAAAPPRSAATSGGTSSRYSENPPRTVNASRPRDRSGTPARRQGRPPPAGRRPRPDHDRARRRRNADQR